MKKKLIVLGAIAMLLGLVGCQSSNDANVPTMLDAPSTPTVTVAPTNEVLEPTKAVVEPTQEVVEPTKEVEPTVVPTEEPEITEIPLLSPEPVITEEPEVTPAFSLTVVPTPTETPVATEEPEPMVAPTVQPTEQPTGTPKPKATATPKPTNKPKATATPKPTATPKLAKVPHETHEHKYTMFASGYYHKTKVYDIPSTDGKVVSELNMNTEVQTLECCSGEFGWWMKVKVDGKTGWVFEDDLSYQFVLSPIYAYSSEKALKNALSEENYKKYKTTYPEPTAAPEEAYLPWSSRKEERQRTEEANCYINKSAENYGLVFEELGLPKDFSEYVYYSYDYDEKGKVEQNIRVYIPETMSDYECNSVDKIVYASADKMICVSASNDYILDEIEDLYDSVMQGNYAYEPDNDLGVRKGQEMHAIEYYPYWDIYKVEIQKTSGTNEYYVFGGQIERGKSIDTNKHPYLSAKLENGTYTVMGLSDVSVDGNIEIPSEIDGIPVTKIADGAFDVKGKNFTVTLSDSITYIGNRAFSECKITNTTLPKSLEYVGKSAFWRTDAKFKSLPQSVTYIGEWAFQECAIDNVVIPKEMTKVPDHAFTDCTIKELTLHDNITRIGSHAFNALDLGEDEIINLPKKLTYIGDNGIWGNYGGFTIGGKVPSHYSEIPEHLFELRGEVDILVDSLVSDWEKKYGKLSDLEYTLLAFNWVTKNVNDLTYGGRFEQGESLGIVGEAMLNGRANCHGTLLAVKELLDRAGVENYVTVASMPGHGWNIVVIGDIQYHMDAAWGVFLSSDKEFVNTGCYDGKEIDYSRIDKKEYPTELEGVVIIPNCPKSFPSDQIASAKARLGLK